MKYVYISLLFIFCITDIFCQNNLLKKNINDAAAFELYIKQALPLWKTPGISVVVVKDNQVVYKNGFGKTEFGKTNPFTTSTLSIWRIYYKSDDSCLHRHAGG